MSEVDETTSTDEQFVKKSKSEKKKILLRLDPALHEQLRLWAERDFRSLNAHIEFLLRKAVHKEKD
jgi:hypothetical protein|tara:strand:+ start:311 stop:508 length:198 start_codon:yes stop_codon:yes gene_type:complete